MSMRQLYSQVRAALGETAQNALHVREKLVSQLALLGEVTVVHHQGSTFLFTTVDKPEVFRIAKRVDARVAATRLGFTTCYRI